MKIFQSWIDEQTLLAWDALSTGYKPNLQVSYFGEGGKPYFFPDKHRDKIGSLIIDTGLYTLNVPKMSLNTPLSKLMESLPAFDGYAEFLKKYGYLCEFFFNYDDFFERSNRSRFEDKQLLELKAMGLHAKPMVFYNLFSGNQRYLPWGTDIVGIVASQFDTATLENIAGRLTIAYGDHRHYYLGHLCRASKFKQISELPVYSMDTCNWLRPGARDRILYWNPANPGPDKTDEIFFDKLGSGTSGQKSGIIWDPNEQCGQCAECEQGERCKRDHLKEARDNFNAANPNLSDFCESFALLFAESVKSLSSSHWANIADEFLNAPVKKTGILWGTYKKKDKKAFLAEINTNLALSAADLLSSPNKELNRKLVNMHYFRTLEAVVHAEHLNKGWPW